MEELVNHSLRTDLISLRKSGYSTKELSKKLNLTPRYINYIIKGQRKGTGAKGRLAYKKSKKLYESKYKTYVYYIIKETISPPKVSFSKKIVRTYNPELSKFKGDVFYCEENDYEGRNINLVEIKQINGNNIVNSWDFEEEYTRVKLNL